jgi:hypothetical protein
MNEPVFITNDAVGRLVRCDGIVYYLTPCCQASAKGAECGTVCRACYREVSDDLGWACTESNFPEQYIAWIGTRVCDRI